MKVNKSIKRVLMLFFCVCLVLGSTLFTLDSFAKAKTSPYEWLPEEEAWIKAHRGEILKLGLDPFVGMDYYKIDGKVHGYLAGVLGIIEKDLGLTIEIVDQYDWGTVLNQLRTGQIDILFGANATEERKAYMSFTKPLYQYPYSVYALKGKSFRTLGDLDGRRVGFLEGDAVEVEFPKIYKNIHYDASEFSDQLLGLDAVRKGTVDAFVTANGGITKKYAHDFPDIQIIADISTFTSDMTLSTRIENRVLCQIIDKLLNYRANEIALEIDKSSKAYNRYILGLSKEEEQWLLDHPKIIVGAADDYLPFDYFENGKYKGIAGNFLTEMSNQIGIELEVVHGPFDQLFEQAKSGDIYILNMAKTEARKDDFVFTAPFSEERDEIFGDRKLPYLQDIYELENKRVAVVTGYWHKDYLTKNLSHAVIVETTDLKESLKFVAEGKADYFIENPTVAKYYIDGLGYSNILQKGTTSQDSFLYFGIPVSQAPLAGILNKAMPLVRYEKIKSVSLQEVPSQKNVMTTRLVYLLIGFSIALAMLILYLFKLIRELINQKAKQKVLEEREKLIYLDGLTGLHNRLYFNSIEPQLDNSQKNQIYLMADLNGLKHVNDTYGHIHGDQFICAFSEALKATFSPETIIRMGGDEFLVILLGWNLERLEIHLDILEEECKKRTFAISAEESLTPVAARGWAIRYAAATNSVNESIVEADQMMYQHKASLKRRRNDH